MYSAHSTCTECIQYADSFFHRLPRRCCRCAQHFFGCVLWARVSCIIHILLLLLAWTQEQLYPNNNRPPVPPIHLPCRERKKGSQVSQRARIAAAALENDFVYLFYSLYLNAMEIANKQRKQRIQPGKQIRSTHTHRTIPSFVVSCKHKQNAQDGTKKRIYSFT